MQYLITLRPILIQFFSGSGVSHCTGVPYNVPDVPNVLKGKKAYGTVVNQELVVKDFSKKV